ncbi:MAG: hypothetical protein ACRCU2_13065 [Planktothrix sp.]
MNKQLMNTEEDWQEFKVIWGKLERNQRADRLSQTLTPNSYPNRLQLHSNPACSSSAAPAKISNPLSSSSVSIAGLTQTSPTQVLSCFPRKALHLPRLFSTNSQTAR